MVFCSALTSNNINIMVSYLMIVMIVYVECHNDVMTMILCRQYVAIAMCCFFGIAVCPLI